MRNEMGELPSWKTAVFQDGTTLYHVTKGNTLTVTERIAHRHKMETELPSNQHVICDGFAFHETGKFYALASQDCYDPPVAIIRAEDRDETTAVDVFIEECPYSCKLSTEDVNERQRDGTDENVSWTNGGIPYASELLYMREVKLVRVEF